jgi:cobaltochelatase CobN
VQKAKAMDEADNLVRKHYLATKATLVAKGYKEQDADRLAGVRIFDEAPGNFNLNTAGIVAASGSWDKDAGFANEYLRKMGHGYGNGYWGESMEDVFRLALAGTDKIVHSSSTTLYGALDNDDMFMYMGGLASAVRSIDGKTPELVVTNTRDPGKGEMTPIDEFIGKEFRSRYVNPVWIDGMKKEGYAGAGEMRAFVEYMWGWDATASSVVDDAMWKETFDVYVKDKYGKDLKSFFDTRSPFAYQDIVARMLETVRKDYWQADAETKTKLVREFIESVNAHGVSCSDTTCGNARLLEYALDAAPAAGIAAADVARARAALEKAIGKRIDVAARALRDFAVRNDAREVAATESAQTAAATADAVAQTAAQPAAAPGKAAAAAAQLRGLLLEASKRTKSAAQSAVAAGTEESPFAILWLGLPLLGVLWFWRQRYRRLHA